MLATGEPIQSEWAAFVQGWRTLGLELEGYANKAVGGQ